MTTSKSSKAFEIKPRKLKNERQYKKKQKNGQSELLRRCLFKKSRNLINHVYNIFTFLPFVAKPVDRLTF